MDSLAHKHNKEIKFGLFSRMLAALFLLLLSTLAILSVSLLKNAANQFNEFRLEHVQSMARTLSEGSLDALITEDYELLERFVKSSLPSYFGAYAYLTRPNGQILSSTDLSLIATKITPPQIIDTDISRSLTYQNRPIIEVVFKTSIGKQHLANTHIAYYTDQGNFSYFGQAKEIILALIILLFVILVGTYIIVSRIRTPVLKLINTVVNTSHDNPIHLPQEIFWRNDEVGTLARAFDDVFTKLSFANKKINDAKDNLELKVQQRTQQLLEKNDEFENTQKRINAIMDNAGDSIITINKNGIIDSFNLAAQNLFGYTLNEIQGKNINILMPEPYSSAHDGYLKKYFETGIQNIIGVGGREVIGKRKDNSEFPMELLVSHLTINDENLFVGIVRDITLQKESRDILQRSNESLENEVNKRTVELNNINKDLIQARDAALDASTIKSEFMSTISHELRTPLHSISGYESLLKMSNLDENQSEYCKKISLGTQNLLDIINDILDFSDFESGGLKVKNKNFSITNTLNDICDMFSQSAKQKGLILTHQIDKDIPVSIYTDPNRLRQIIVNLLRNAIKFTEQGSITVTAKLNRTTNTNHQELLISIIDTGIGIEDEEFKRIFNPFYQIDGSVTRAHGGTGIGLAISEKLIELMGGKISIESHLDQGSTFTILLPLIAEENHDLNIENEYQTIYDSNEISSNSLNVINPDLNKKIIIVEDNLINAELLTLILNDIGYDPDIAENGQIFLDMMKENNYDLVLMDCQMPILNGYDATKQYRHSENYEIHIPIIAVTANAMTGDKEKCLASGMDDYISKPVNPNILKKTIHHWLSISH